MQQAFSRRSFLRGIGAVGLLTALSSCTRVPQMAANGLPAQTVWSTYPTGTGTYNDVAALANMLTNRSGMTVRLMTSDTGIGRVGPLINETARYARAGDEYYYAFEGDDEFASETWGPQPLRMMWTPPGNYGVLVREDSGIENVSDLRGKRYPRLISSISMNRKLEAILNFEGLTLDDVELVDLGYAEQAEAMKTGQLDAMYQNVVGGAIEELNSEYPIRWLDLGDGTPEQYSTWEELAPNVIVGEFENGVGMEPGEVGRNMQYSIPLTIMADHPTAEVKEILHMIRDNFDDFKDATPDAHKFSPDEVMLLPLVVPFHEGTVEFFKEIGRWTPGLQRRNDALLEREQLMQEQWPTFWAENSEADNPSELWRAWKRENLPALPEVNDVDPPSTIEGKA